MSTKVPRSEPANNIQRARLMALVYENPVLITRKLTNEFTFEKYQALWRDVQEQLNRLGPKKDIKAWQKYLTDQKTRVKKKKAEIVVSVRKTGGGCDDLPNLAGDEEKFLTVMGGRMVVDGDESVDEFGINIPQEIAQSSFGNYSFENSLVKECIEEDDDVIEVFSTGENVVKPPLSIPSSSEIVSHCAKPPLSMPTSSKIDAKQETDSWQKWFQQVKKDNISLSTMRENIKAKASSKASELATPSGTSTTESVKNSVPRNRKSRRMTQESFENTVGFRDTCLKNQTEALSDIAKALEKRNEIETKKIEVLQQILARTSNSSDLQVTSALI